MYVCVMCIAVFYYRLAVAVSILISYQVHIVKEVRVDDNLQQKLSHWRVFFSLSLHPHLLI